MPSETIGTIGEVYLSVKDVSGKISSPSATTSGRYRWRITAEAAYAPEGGEINPYKPGHSVVYVLYTGGEMPDRGSFHALHAATGQSLDLSPREHKRVRKRLTWVAKAKARALAEAAAG